MENASKALIMAGGMILAILITSLLVFAWNSYSKYQSSKDELSDYEDVAEFNEQFASYDRDEVLGYEILSLVNKINDYNYRKSNDSQAKGKDKYSSLTIKISFGSQENLKKLSYDGNTPLLFNKMSYEVTTDDATSNPFKEKVKQAEEIAKNFGGTDNATKVAKSISSIILKDSDESDEQKKAAALKKYNSLVATGKSYTDYQRMKREQKENIYGYYEYIQLKKSIFKAEKVEYDTTGTGRIKSMEFSFNKIK